MAVLVTGGTGYVGRWVVRALADAGHSVRVLTRRDAPADDPRVRPVPGDLMSPGDVERAVAGCGAVVHCAGEKSATGRMHAVNVTGTTHVFEAARSGGVPFFCHLSSVGTIGRTEQVVVDESTPCAPMNRYEETKLAAEQVVAKGLPGGRVVILRPTNVFGAETIRVLLDASPAGRVRRLLTGRERAHLVYVKDVAAAAVHFLGGRSDPVTTYIVSSDEDAGNTNREVTAYLGSRVAGAPRPPAFAAPLAVPHLLRRLRHGAANRGDIIYSSKKLRAAGFTFAFGLHRGLDDAIGAAR